jgi:hypothetical protein
MHRFNCFSEILDAESNSWWIVWCSRNGIHFITTPASCCSGVLVAVLSGWEPWSHGWISTRLWSRLGAFGAAILVNHKTEKEVDALVQFSYWVYFPMNLPSGQLFALLLQVCVEENTSCRAPQVCSPGSQQNFMWLLFICCQFSSSSANWQRKWKL